MNDVLKSKVAWAVLTAASLILGALRIAGFKSEFYQAVAHVFVGGLFGAAIVTGEKNYWLSSLGLTAVEISVFAATFWA